MIYIEALESCMWLSTLPYKHGCACKAALVWSRDLSFTTPWSEAVSEIHVLMRSEINPVLTSVCPYKDPSCETRSVLVHTLGVCIALNSDQSGQNPPLGIKQGTHKRNALPALTSELMLEVQLVQNWVWFSPAANQICSL